MISVVITHIFVIIPRKKREVNENCRCVRVTNAQISEKIGSILPDSLPCCVGGERRF